MFQHARLVGVQPLSSSIARHFSQKVSPSGETASNKKSLVEQLYERSNTPFVTTQVPEQAQALSNAGPAKRSDKQQKEEIRRAKRAAEYKKRTEQNLAEVEIIRTASSLSAAPIAPLQAPPEITSKNNPARRAAASLAKSRAKAEADAIAAKIAHGNRKDNMAGSIDESSLNSMTRPTTRPPRLRQATPEQVAAMPLHIQEERRRKIQHSRDSLRQGLDQLNRLTEYDDPNVVRSMMDKSLKEAAARREALVQQVGKSITVDPLLEVESDGQVHNPLNVDGVPEAFRHRLPPELMGISPLTRKRLLEEGKSIEDFRIPQYVLDARKLASANLTVQGSDGKTKDLGLSLEDYEAVIAMRQAGGKEFERRMNIVLSDAGKGHSSQATLYVRERVYNSPAFRGILASTDVNLAEERAVAEKVVRFISEKYHKIGIEHLAKIPREKREAIVQKLNAALQGMPKVGKLSEEERKKLAQYDMGAQSGATSNTSAPVTPKKPMFEFLALKRFFHHISSVDAFCDLLESWVIKLQNSAARSRVRKQEAATRPPGKVNFPIKWFLFGMTFIIVSFSLTTIWDYYMEMVHGITPPSAFKD